MSVTTTFTTATGTAPRTTSTIKRIELDVYGLESFGPEEQYEAAFSRDASIMVMLSRGQYTDHPLSLLFGTSQCKKLALYDVATGKLLLKKR